MTLLILGGAEVGEALAAELVRQGVSAVRCTHDGAEDLSPAQLQSEFNATAAAISAVLIVVTADDRACRAAELTELDGRSWTAAFERPLRRTRIRLQAAGELLGAGGRVIFVATTGGMLGVAGDVAGCALEEGARALAKSVALAWKASGRSICFAAFEPAALTTAEGRAGALVPMLMALLSAPPALTGATIIADGGQLLAP